MHNVVFPLQLLVSITVNSLSVIRFQQFEQKKSVTLRSNQQLIVELNRYR